jgi:hypothetical protein
MRLLLDLCAFLRYRKKLWLLPVISIMLVLGALVALAESSALAPFIYSIF